MLAKDIASSFLEADERGIRFNYFEGGTQEKGSLAS